MPPLPPPTTRPAPNAAPQVAFAHITAALTAPQLPITLSTLHAHAAPNATFAGYPVPADPATWPDTLAAALPKNFALPFDIGWTQEVERTDTRSRWLFRTHSTRSSPCFECSLTLIRDGPAHPDPAWRLASFDILKCLG